jgi:2-oxoisovalerate dehydrogenase E1 component beta subunit
MKPKALMRVRGDELIPGEPAEDKELRAMIDAPIGDRTKWKPRWPKLEHYTVPIGKAKVTRAGDQLTVVSWGRMLLTCNQVADELREEGYSVEVIDLRSMIPYDWTAIKASVEKTGRFVCVNEDTDLTNFGEHLSYRVTEELFYNLLSRPRVLAGKHLPGIGLHPNLEDASIPQKENIKALFKESLVEIP